MIAVISAVAMIVVGIAAVISVVMTGAVVSRTAVAVVSSSAMIAEATSSVVMMIVVVVSVMTVAMGIVATSSVAIMIAVISAVAMIVVGIVGVISVVMTDAVVSSSAMIAEATSVTTAGRTLLTSPTPRRTSTSRLTAMSRRFPPASAPMNWIAMHCARSRLCRAPIATLLLGTS